MRDNRGHMGKSPREMAVFCATYWEIKRFIASLPFQKISRSTYRFSGPDTSVTVVLTGMGPGNASQAAEGFCDSWESASALSGCLFVSTGFAGALREDIRAGDVVLDEERSDPFWAERARKGAEKCGVPFHAGRFATLDRPVFSSREKSALARDAGGALAVEMESRAVHEVCRKRGAPFLSLRTVSDGLRQSLPRAAAALNPDGSPGPAFFLSLAARPREWPDFFQLVKSSGKAAQNLAATLKEVLTLRG